MKDKKKETLSSDRLSAKTEGFLSSNKKSILIICVLVVVIVAVIAVISIFTSSSSEATATAVYNLESEYNSIRNMDEASADYATAGQAFVADAEVILAENSDGYAYLKTNYLLGLYYYNVAGDWALAQACFETAAAAASGTYMGSLALMNAAASAENNGDQDTALAYYNQVWDDYGRDAAESPKALFNAARIYEAQGDIELASATYSQLADEFQGSEYAALARARNIVLGAE